MTRRTVDSPLPGTCTINYDHRLDGPAHIGVYPNDNNDHLIIIWYNHTAEHRLDGPATTTSDGNIFWEVDGVVDVASISDPPQWRPLMTAHTTTGTATTRTVVSHLPGAYTIRHDHRLDGPVHIGFYPNDNIDHLMTIWREPDHRYHRLDGPAITTSGGNIYWTVEHTNITHLNGGNS